MKKSTKLQKKALTNHYSKMISKNSICLLLLVCITVSSFFVQIHADNLDGRNIDPKIMNAELHRYGRFNNEPIFDDLTNNLNGIKKDGKSNYDDYMFVYNQQNQYLQKDIWGDFDDTDIYGVILHPKTFTSMKSGQGPVYSLVHKISGPISSRLKQYSYFENGYGFTQEDMELITAHWESVKVTDIKNEGPENKHLHFTFTNNDGQVEEKQLEQKQNLYDLIYYRYLQANNKQNEIAEFEAKIKAQPPFFTLKDAGVKRCKKSEAKVYCSRGFPFLGAIDANHPHFEAYSIAYSLRYGEDIVTKKDLEDVIEKENGAQAPEQLMKELPFHRLQLTIQKPGNSVVVDLDVDKKEITSKDPFYNSYEQVAIAQAEKKKDILEKRERHDVPILVREQPGEDDPIYAEFTEEGAFSRKITGDDPDYTFAKWSFNKIQTKNEELSKLKAKLEKGNVNIQAKVTSLSETPIFMINDNPEEIPFEDPRYELIRYYHLENLRKGKQG